MKTIVIECLDGIPRRVKMMSLTKREEFATMAADLSSYLTKLQQDKRNHNHTYRTLYDSDERFRTYCKSLLITGNVNPEWVDLDLMVRLLFPHKDEDDRQHHRGALLEFNFDEPNKGVGDSMTYEEVLALIWNSADSLAAAVDAAENVPLDVIVNSIIAKAEQLKPPAQRLKDKNKKRAMEDIEDIQSGKLELPDIGNLQEVDL